MNLSCLFLRGHAAVRSVFLCLLVCFHLVNSPLALTPVPNTAELAPAFLYFSLNYQWRLSSTSCWSVTKSCSALCDPMDLQYARLICPPVFPGVCSNSCSLSQWCYLTISSRATCFSFCLQSFPASGSFPMNWLFTSGGQSIGASTSVSVLPVNIQDWFPLELTGLISLHSKGLSRGFSNTTVQKEQFLGSQTSLWSNSHIHTWLLVKP